MNINYDSDEKIDDFFYLIKSQDYNKAGDIIDSLDVAPELIEEFTILNILLSKGFQGNKDFVELNNITKKDNYLLQCIKLLNSGYYKFYFDPDKKGAYIKFHEALKISLEINYPPLIKVCLISILEYYRTEVARNDRNYLDFLIQYEKLELDKIDELLMHLYKLIFQSSHVQGIDEEYFDLSLKLLNMDEKLSSGHPLKSRIYFEQALFFEFQNDWEKAKEYFEKALFSSQNFPHQSYIGFSSTLKIAEYYNHIGEPSRSINQLEQINKFFNPNDSLRDNFYLSRYKSIYHNELDECCLAYDELMESVDAGYLLDFRKSGQEIAELQVELQTHQKELENSQLRNRLNIIFGIIILSVFVATFIHKNTTKKRLLAEQQSELKQQRVDNLLKEQELVSIDAMIAGQEKERQKVANELHDDLGSLMATIKLHLDQAEISQSDNSLKTAQNLLEKAYQKIRGISHAKNSGVMSNQGLIPALEKMADLITQSNGLEVKVEHFGMGERLENSVELTIFRMIQELITNILKHANATKANIQLTQHEENINIIVEDNGKGFDYSAMLKNKGMGITNIEKRIESLDGSFTVDSVPGKGTSILIDLPL